MKEVDFSPFEAKIARGRFPDELNVELNVGGERFCRVKIFRGRPPHYGAWAEVFHINPALIGTQWEERLYRLLYEAMDPGDVLYVEYVDDPETYKALYRGVPPQETRLGRLLTKCGFRVVKDWYFPEGWLEGGPKLQAEKP